MYRYISTYPIHIHLNINNFLHSINIIYKKYTIILKYENFLSQILIIKHKKLTKKFNLSIHNTKKILLKYYI